MNFHVRLYLLTIVGFSTFDRLKRPLIWWFWWFPCFREITQFGGFGQKITVYLARKPYSQTGKFTVCQKCHRPAVWPSVLKENSRNIDILLIFGDFLGLVKVSLGQRSFLRGFKVRKDVQKVLLFVIFLKIRQFGHFGVSK